MASFGSAFKASAGVAVGTSIAAGEPAGTYTYTAPAGGFAILQHVWAGSVQPVLTVGGKRLTGPSTLPNTLPNLVTGIYVGPGQTISTSFTGASNGYAALTGVEYSNS